MLTLDFHKTPLEPALMKSSSIEDQQPAGPALLVLGHTRQCTSDQRIDSAVRCGTKFGAAGATVGRGGVAA